MGFLLQHSIVLSFALNVLSILFLQGNSHIYKTFEDSLSKINEATWLPVIPQILARANSNNPELRQLILNLLIQVAMKHPHPILYSLMVPLMGELSERQQISRAVFEKLQSNFPSLINDIHLLTDELIRISVTWWENWYSNVDESSRALLTRNDPEEMMNILFHLHTIIRPPPETIYETKFMSVFGHMTRSAELLLQSYKNTHRQEQLSQAWQWYINIYRQTKNIVSSLTQIVLSEASPKLASTTNLSICVPGTYNPSSPLITVQSIEPTLKILSSKQRPRRMNIVASNGSTFTFLLKAREDTRLDERVMQFFDYLSFLVHQSSLPLKNRLTITTYKVIPLTHEVGLIGWLDNSSTIFDAVFKYRTKKRIPIKAEYDSVIKKYPNYLQIPCTLR